MSKQHDGAAQSAPRWHEDDTEPHIEDDLRTGTFEMNYRIVVIDNHIIAQSSDGHKWYTCSKANNSDESDFALWPFSQANLNKAVKLVGNVPITQASCKPISRGNSWYVSADDHSAKGYNQALRELARALP